MELHKKRAIHDFIINSKITNSRSLHLSTHELRAYAYPGKKKKMGLVEGGHFAARN